MLTGGRNTDRRPLFRDTYNWLRRFGEELEEPLSGVLVGGKAVEMYAELLDLDNPVDEGLTADIDIWVGPQQDISGIGKSYYGALTPERVWGGGAYQIGENRKLIPEYDLPTEWINHGLMTAPVVDLLSQTGHDYVDDRLELLRQSDDHTTYEFGSLKITIPSPETLYTMKYIANRDKDHGHLLVLQDAIDEIIAAGARPQIPEYV